MNRQNQKEKAKLFLKLHQDKEILVLLNSWDPGSSRLVEASGYKAIGTTSMGISASLGYPDCQTIPFKEMLEAIVRIVDKVKVPVTVDIEGGYGKNIQEIIDSTKKIINTGIVGINIEDSFNLNPKLLDEEDFCTRISAIRELSTSLGFHLVINARTDVFITASGSLKNRLAEAIKRGNKYREAGADCIFVPDVWEIHKIADLVNEINAPVNILSNPTNGTGFPPSLGELEDLGVARVSLGSSVMKSTLSLIKKIADELTQKGTYNVLSDSLTPMQDTLVAYKMATGSKKNQD
jgi:2-methylisocitrate lyase-like PEP mutase family enzyme